MMPCNMTALTGMMPNPWAWIVNATYSGSRVVRNRTLNFFSYRPMPTQILEIGCFEGAETVPVEEHFSEPGHETFVEFHTFSPMIANMSIFNVRPNCTKLGAHAPAKCNPSMTFEAHGRFHFRGPDGEGFGDYTAAHSVSLKEGMDEGRVDLARHEHENFWSVSDYLTEKRYDEDSVTHVCNVTALKGDLPNPWAWIALSTYSGQRVIRNRTLNTFTYKPTPEHILEIGCFEGAETIPIEEHFREPGHEAFIEYHTFSPMIANASIFNLRANCNSSV